MNKLMFDEMHSERRDIEAWCKKYRIAEPARDELLRILYGKPDLTKGASHDRQ